MLKKIAATRAKRRVILYFQLFAYLSNSKQYASKVGYNYLSFLYCRLQLYYMSDINIKPIQSIVNKHHPTLQLMHNHAIAQSHKIARQVYNRQSRNITQFIRQQLIFNKKMAQKQHFFGKNNNLPKRKRFGVTLRYEENETLELSFDRNTPNDKEDIISQANKVQNTTSERDSRQQTYKSSKKSFLKSGNLSIFKVLPRTKQNERTLSIPVHNRKKTFTISSPRANLSPNSQINSAHSIKSRASRRRVMTQIQPIEDSLTYANSRQKTSQDQTYGNNNQLIALNRQKMEKFIKNLHRLEWMADFLQGKAQAAEESEQFKQHLRNFHYDSDLPISEDKLNYMVSRRYGLLTFYLEDHYAKKIKQLKQHETAAKRQRFASHKDYPILEMASKRSILTLMHKEMEDRPVKFFQRQNQQVDQGKISFSLPFAEFISERQTKASIYRLVRMSQISYLKIAFGLYDKNKNGIIDEDDLLQAVSLSRKMPQIQSDLLVLCSTFNTPRLSVIRHKQKTISEREKSHRDKKSFIQLIKPIEQLQFQSRAQSEQESIKNPKSTRFSLDKFYIFLKNKKDQNKQPTNAPKRPNISFTFAAFCRAFDGHRPAILTDLFQFLFGAQKQDFVESQDIVSIKSFGRFEDKPSQKQQTLEQKWNNRIKNTNEIVKKLIEDAKNL